MDWLDLLAVQGTLKSLLQHHSSKASILLCSAFFIVQLSHPYLTTGKSIALTRQSFVSKVMSCVLACCLSWSQASFQGAGEPRLVPLTQLGEGLGLAVQPCAQDLAPRSGAWGSGPTLPVCPWPLSPLAGLPSGLGMGVRPQSPWGMGGAEWPRV